MGKTYEYPAESGDTDPNLRANLAAAGGAALIGYDPSGTVQSKLATAISDITALGASNLAAATLTDADATKTVSQGSEFTLPVATLSANRTATISTAGAVEGDVVRFRRKDTTAFTYAIVNGGAGAGTLYTFPASVARVADFRFDGTNWVLSGHARLA